MGRPEVVAASRVLQHKTRLPERALFLGRAAGLLRRLDRRRARSSAWSPRAGRRGRRRRSTARLSLQRAAAWSSSAHRDLRVGRLGHVARAPLVLHDLRRDLHRRRRRSRRSRSASSSWRRSSGLNAAPSVLTTRQLHDLGNLLLAFMMLWAYIAFSQYLIIWSGNLPEEITWYLAGIESGWSGSPSAPDRRPLRRAVPRACCRETSKRDIGSARLGRGLLLVMRFVDLFWLIAPAFDATALHASLARPHRRPSRIGGIWLALLRAMLSDASRSSAERPEVRRRTAAHIHDAGSARGTARPTHENGRVRTRDAHLSRRHCDGVRPHRHHGLSAGRCLGRLRRLQDAERPRRRRRRAFARWPASARVPPEPAPEADPDAPTRGAARPRGRDPRTSYGWVDSARQGSRDSRSSARWSLVRRRGSRRSRRAATRDQGSRPAMRPGRICTRASSPSCLAMSSLRRSPRRTAVRRPRPTGDRRSSASVGFDQRLGEQMPLDLTFTRRDGRDRPPRRLLREEAGHPGARLLRVPDALHPGAERPGAGTLQAARASTSGKEFDVVTRQLRSRERRPRRACERRSGYLDAYGRAGRRSGLALPDRRAAVDRSARGRRSGSATSVTTKTKQFAHASGIMVADARGQARALLLRHRVRADGPALRARRGAEDKIGSPVDQLLLFCFHYDPPPGKYGAGRA